MATATSALDILVRARALISDPRNWCQSRMAVTALGTSVHPRDDMAVRWSAGGAIVRHANPFGSDEIVMAAFDAVDALDAAAHDTYPNMPIVSQLNDHLGHDAVLRIYDAAIVASER